MNILNKTKVYLVGGIENFGIEARTWREYTSSKLHQIGVKCFDPFKKPFLNSVEEDEKTRDILLKLMSDGNYKHVREHMRRVRAFDLRLVDLSDFVIACISPTKASWGSADEIFTALRLRKPTFIVVEGGVSKTPLWIVGSIPTEYLFNNLDECLNRIIDINSGKYPIDDKYWRLLDEKFR